jgi:DNA-binding transcriptional LysR family regulator
LLDTHQLRVFLAAAEMLNFSHAAKRLHMSQPSVTQHIHNLETHFGMPLFIRAGRKLSLTEAGVTLLPMARDLVLAAVRADELMDTLKEEIHGNLWIACTTTPGKYILPSLMADFLKKHPKVEATISVSSRNDAMRFLNEGKAHIMVSSVFNYHPDIEFHKFITEPLVLIVPPNHPWTKRGSIKLDELRKANLIMREPSAGSYMVLRDGLAQKGFDISDLRKVLTLGNSEAIAFAVQEGIGVGFVSMLVAQMIVKDQVAIVEVDDLALSQDIYIGQHRRLPATPAQVAFWKMTTEPRSEALLKIKSYLNGVKEP